MCWMPTNKGYAPSTNKKRAYYWLLTSGVLWPKNYSVLFQNQLLKVFLDSSYALFNSRQVIASKVDSKV